MLCSAFVLNLLIHKECHKKYYFKKHSLRTEKRKDRLKRQPWNNLEWTGLTIWNGIKKILEFPTFDVQWKMQQFYSALSDESYMPRTQPFFKY